MSNIHVMKNKNLITLSFSLLLTLTMFSQGLISSDNARSRILSAPLYQDNIDLKAFYESVTGSPYIYDAFLPAKVNDYKDIVAARFDAYKNQITIQINSTKEFYLDKKLGNKIKFINTSESYQIFHDEKDKPEFFKVLKANEKYSLLIRHEVKLNGGQKPKNSYDQYKPASFKRAKDKLYLSLDNKSALKVPSNKKKFYKIFQKKGNKMKEFIKKNKLNIKKQADLLKILEFYTTV